MTKFFIFGLVGLLVVAVILVLNLRTFKTIYLIYRVTPFEKTLPNAPKILVLGDSTGYGTGATNNKNTIAGRIGNDFVSYDITNDSKNGRTIGELVPVASKVSDDYELILLQIGGNDILQQRDLKTVEAELRENVAALSLRTKHLVMISTGNVGAASAFSEEKAALMEAETRAFRTMSKTVADDTDLVFVDLFVEPRDDLFLKQPETYLSIDGLHPSDAGYGLWYETLQPELTKILQSK